MTSHQETLQIEMRVRARPETVFAYFTDPDKYRTWKGHAARLDPRPGGAYEVDMVGPAGVRGEYVELDPPRRVVFTWGWNLGQGPPGIAEVPPGSTRVEIDFEPDGDDATIVRLRHSGLPGEVAAIGHRWGWNHSLERLRRAAQGETLEPDPLPDLVAGHPLGAPWLDAPAPARDAP